MNERGSDLAGSKGSWLMKARKARSEDKASNGGYLVTYLLSLCLILCASFAQAESLDALAHWRRATLAIGQTGPNPEGKGATFLTFGSAVLIAKDDKHVCLLTAKHLLYDPIKQSFPDFIYVRLPKDADGDEDLGVRLQITDGGHAIWKSLDDGSDLAVIDAPDLSRYWNVNAVSLKDFGDEKDVYQGGQVLVFGYPGILGQAFLNTPLARTGIVSWIDPVKGLDVPFLIDANIFGGNSGGPVFHIRNGIQKDGSLAIGGGYTFIGIVVRDAQEFAPIISDYEQGKTGERQEGNLKGFTNFAIVENIGGIGIIEPATKAKELAEKSCFR